MPPKQRRTKRRLPLTAELEAWEIYFNSGYDYFDELPEIGVETDDLGRPERAVGEAAWHRLGARFLADSRPRQREPWALTEFGEPDAA